MAQARRRTTRYETYGSVAYEPQWGGDVITLPGGQELTQPRPKVRPEEKTLARPKVQVREAGKVSPFAVIGFFCVGVLAVLLLMSCVRLTVLKDESVQLEAQLAQLQKDEATLLARYEMAYDLKAMEAQLTADGTMVKPTNGQMVVLDLSEPDNVVAYEQSAQKGGILAWFGGLFD